MYIENMLVGIFSSMGVNSENKSDYDPNYNPSPFCLRKQSFLISSF